MLSLEEARRRVVASVSVLDPIEVPLNAAAGLVIAEDIVATEPSPRFDNSAMDGYALRAEDVLGASATTPVRLRLVGEVRAGGAEPGRVSKGATLRVMTGAPLPPGADSVIPVEDAHETEDHVIVGAAVARGTYVRRAGEDVMPGVRVVASGTELFAGELALLASMGRTHVRVFPRPRVALLVTGDELVDMAEDPGPGLIRDSNSTALKTLVEESGGENSFYERVADQWDAALTAFERAAQAADLIVSSGGVAVGRYDLVKRAVEVLGRIDFWKVAMKPGKPLVLGEVHGIPILGLPGNPVSAHVTFEQFARPAIRKLRGCGRLFRPTITARLGAALEHRTGRLELVRVRLERSGPTWIATPTGPQGSHIQSSLVDAHGLALFPAEAAKLDAGAEVTVEVWRLPEEA